MTIITEGDILLSSIKYLITERQVLPYRISVPSGKGIEHNEIKEKVKDIYPKCEPDFVNSGADIIGVSTTEWWCVECKGSGAGKPSTQRNNFDRALASCVTYYEDNPNFPSSSLAEFGKNAQVCLGLAIPASDGDL